MTPEEYRQALTSLSKDRCEWFMKRIGGGFTTTEEYVRHFIDHPDTERKIVHVLRPFCPGLRTEAEKNLEASVRSANAAESSARSAKRAFWAALLALLVSLAALIVSIWASGHGT